MNITINSKYQNLDTTSENIIKDIVAQYAFEYDTPNVRKEISNKIEESLKKSGIFRAKILKEILENG